MRKLTIKTDFPYYHKGYERRDYVAGEEVETDDDEFADVATEEGWAEEAGADPKPPKATPKTQKAS